MSLGAFIALSLISHYFLYSQFAALSPLKMIWLMVVGSGSERNFWQIPQSSALSSLPPAAFRAMVAFHLPLWSGHFLPIFLCGFPPPGMPSALYSLAVRPKHPNLPLAQTLIFAFKPFVAALISCISHTGPIRSASSALLYSLVK